MIENNKNEIFKNRAYEVHGKTYGYDDVDITLYKVKVPIMCFKHGIFMQTPSAHLQGYACKECANERARERMLVGLEEFIRRARIIHGDKYDYSKSVYVNSKTHLIIICPIHGEFLQTPTDHIDAKHGCPKCGKEKASAGRANGLVKFTEKANIKHGWFYDYNLIKEYINNKTPVPIVCPIHGMFMQRPDSHLSGKGCTACGYTTVSEKLAMSNEEFIGISKLLFGDVLNYDKLDFNNQNDKITLECLEHGEFTTTPNEHINALRSCPKCPKSKGELALSRFFNNCNIKHIREYRIPTTPRYAYDFYLPDLNVLIEYDGVFHYRSVKELGGELALKQSKERDRIKNELAKELNIVLIRIHYSKLTRISEYLSTKLAELFPNKFKIEIQEYDKIMLNSIYKHKLVEI